MSFLGKATGYFNLEKSDIFIGSFFTIEDTLEILEINETEVPEIRIYLERLKVLKNGYVDETILYKYFTFLKTIFSKKPHVNRTSLDEYILIAIIRREFPDMEIEQQPRVLGNKHSDLLLTYKGKKVYVEFDGPGHFISNKYLEDPFIRSKQIEDETGIEVVRWPYWIQRCAQNVKVIFDPSQKGYGSLWSCNAHFGDFTIDSAPVIIKRMTDRFNAVRDNGIGYFYEANKFEREQPEHPIIRKILKGKESRNLLIPNKAEDVNFWLPQCLQ